MQSALCGLCMMLEAKVELWMLRMGLMEFWCWSVNLSL